MGVGSPCFFALILDFYKQNIVVDEGPKMKPAVGMGPGNEFN